MTSALALCALAAAGCTSPIKHDFDPFAHAACYDVPRELQKATLPAYRVEPPDVLLIEVAHNIRSPYEPIKAGEDLIIRADLPGENATQSAQNTANLGVIGLTDYHVINGFYRVQADGSIDLGPIYGAVKVAGLTTDRARQVLADHVRTNSGIADVKASVSFSDVSGRQVISGEHLIRPDGQISLGIYGNLRVAGMTLDQVADVVTAHLRNYLTDPEVRVDVLGYNSKVFYVVTDGGGNGERVDRIPFTGNETVLDAVAQIQGLSDISSKRSVGCPPVSAGLCRLAGDDGGLAGHHPGRVDRDELSSPSGRPHLHQGRRSDRLGQLACQNHNSHRTRVRRNPAGSGNV